MSITSEYKCDRCGHTQNDRDKPRQFWSIWIEYRSEAGRARQSGAFGNSRPIQADWCRTCMAAFGLMPTDDVGATIPEPTPKKTMEDYVREIAREEAADVVGN